MRSNRNNVQADQFLRPRYGGLGHKYIDALQARMEANLHPRVKGDTVPVPEPKAASEVVPDYQPIKDPPFPYIPNICCLTCGRGGPVTGRAARLIRWIAKPTDSPPFYEHIRGAAVTDVCWNCVENPDNRRWDVGSNVRPLLPLEKTSIYQYMTRVG